MDTMQMVVAIPLCFGSFVHHLWLALLCKIHTNTDEYWVDVISSVRKGGCIKREGVSKTQIKVFRG